MNLGIPTLALYARRNLYLTSRAISKSLERIASGSRITSASDDAAGLAKSKKVESDLSSSETALKNIRDAISLLGTARDSINAQFDIINRMQDLASRAAGAFMSDIERSELDEEFQLLYQQFDQEARNSNYQGLQALDSSLILPRVQVGPSRNDYYHLSTVATRSYDIFAQPYSSTDVVGSGTYSVTQTRVLAFQHDAIASGDFNNNGNMDFVVGDASSNELAILSGNGNGTFSVASTMLTSVSVNDVGTGDLNGDGNIDLIVTSDPDSHIRLYMGNGDGTFQTVRTLSTGGTRQLSVADLNNDGKLDIATTEISNSRAIVFIGNGNGTFQTGKTYSTGSTSQPTQIESIDINGDSYKDMIVSSSTTNLMSVFMNNGNGTFSSHSTYSVSGTPRDIAGGDINGDGNVDLLVANTASSISVFLGNANGTFAAQTTFVTSINPWSIELQDIDADNDLDLVMVSFSDTQLRVRKGSGTGTFGGETGYTVAAATGVGDFVFDDFTNDGVDDIAFSVRNVGIMTLGTSTISVTVVPPLSIASQSEALDAIDTLADARDSLSEAMGKVYGMISRLNFTEETRSLLNEVLAEASDFASSVDLPEEIANLTRAQILQEGALAGAQSVNVQSGLVVEVLNDMRKPSVGKRKSKLKKTKAKP